MRRSFDRWKFVVGFRAGLDDAGIWTKPRGDSLWKIGLSVEIGYKSGKMAKEKLLKFVGLGVNNLSILTKTKLFSNQLHKVFVRRYHEGIPIYKI
jgi:hypothetical protein